jgi:hypothetical protein
LKPNCIARKNVNLSDIEAQLAKLEELEEAAQLEVIEQVIRALEELVS